jgi:pimeloyl-ACP methyl ester carboxylesterase
MTATGEQAAGGYARIGDLDMYYEVHGAGRPPLLLLHGGLETVGTSFGKVVAHFARTRQVVAVEQQGHGRTADLDRPLSFERMADDTAALLRHLGIEGADAFGYSDGGNVALGMAIRHPGLLRRIVVAGTNYDNDGLEPEVLRMFRTARPEDMPAGLREAYERVAPDPGGWARLVAKVMKLSAEFPGWRPEDIRSVRTPALVVVGDTDIVRAEHAVAMFRLLPRARLAVLPGTGHGLRLADPGWLLAMVEEFLDAPMRRGRPG